MALHSSSLAWKIPWMEEPGRLQSMGSQSWTRLNDFTLLLVAGILRGRQKWSLLPSLASWDWKECQVCLSGSMS